MTHQHTPSRQACLSLSERFDLPRPDGFTQNWAQENSVPERINELLQRYDGEPLNDDEKMALMALLLESLNDAMSDGEEPKGSWENIVRLLQRDFSIHQWLVGYWSCWDHSEEEMEDAYALTPRMREIAAAMK